MNRKEKRDRKNANHKRNEKRRGMRKSAKLFGCGEHSLNDGGHITRFVSTFDTWSR